MSEDSNNQKPNNPTVGADRTVQDNPILGGQENLNLIHIAL
jgi:hypothetical protein